MNFDTKFNDSKFVAILDRIVDLFFEFGIRNLNMDDISSHLKISKKTLYQPVVRFNSPRHILNY